MNKRIPILIVVLGFWSFSIPRTHSLSATLYHRSESAACVSCGFSGDCRSCVGGGNATYCETYNCGTCSEEGVCESELISSEERTNSDVRPVFPNIKSRIDHDTIKNIAPKHPRFAATLANLNYANRQSQFYVVHWTPVEILSSDIDRFLYKKENGNYFRKFEDASRHLNRLIQNRQLQEIVYHVTIENPSPNTQIVKIRVITEPNSSTDPPYSFLKIETTYTKDKIGALVKEVSTTWQETSNSALLFKAY